MSRVLDYAMRHPWAITRDWLELIVAVATRENGDVEAIERELGRPLANAREVTVRDGVAIVPVTGPLFRYANVFTRLSRATSFEELSTDIGAALDSSEVRAIVLHIDSPGGQVNGTQETAELIYRGRAVKPIHAHISGQGQSGGYWIPSAASSISVGATALVGSIGAVFTVTDRGAADARDGVRTLEIVSSQSPKKRLDPFSDEGRAEWQKLIDDMADVFIDAVARNRSVSRETVLEEFGQGGSFVGQAAVDAGLADRVSTLEDVIAELSRTGQSGRSFVAPPAARGEPATREGTMPGETKTPAAENGPVMSWEQAEEHFAPQIAEKCKAERAEGVAEGATRERERILGILDLPAQGFEKLRRECAEDPSCTRGDAAARILDAQGEREGKRKQARLDALKADEKEVADLGADAADDVEPGSVQAQAQRLLSAAPKRRAHS